MQPLIVGHKPTWSLIRHVMGCRALFQSPGRQPALENKIKQNSPKLGEKQEVYSEVAR